MLDWCRGLQPCGRNVITLQDEMPDYDHSVPCRIGQSTRTVQYDFLLYTSLQGADDWWRSD
ncbi:MAG: hypothetical protein ACOCO9_00340 [Segatella copri]